ncbi:uncharacterized protein LOC110705891 [Chenopodium quinoa]|uniref:uncharacterized protein LOC110705891 n=1 Tax=Chenopodium quinoa TaxID=63459 RepID=UPI000B785E36|nr:uncharacterized protein LOC110705891 [Chenopodium quinoa]
MEVTEEDRVLDQEEFNRWIEVIHSSSSAIDENLKTDACCATLVCYILCAKPPLAIINGFVRRVRGKFGVDKDTGDHEEMVSGLNLAEETIDEVPVWIRMAGLDLKFWGQNALMKLASLVGKPVRTDKETATKERLDFARIMVEFKFNVVLPDHIEFLDENGQNVNQKIEYEWRPVVCKVCEGMGHADPHCPNHKVQAWMKQKVQPKKEWRPVIKKSSMQQKEPVHGNRINGSNADNVALGQNNTRIDVGKSFRSEIALGQGLNMPSKLCDVLWFMRQQSIGFFGLLETKVKRNKFGKVFARMGNDWAETQLVHCTVVHKATSIGFEVPWMVGGDFNNVLHLDDRVGSVVSIAEVEPFRQCLSDASLFDWKAGGMFYTWSNKQDGLNRVSTKTDRVLVNNSWLDTFPYMQANFFPGSLPMCGEMVERWCPNEETSTCGWMLLAFWMMLRMLGV